MNLHLISFCAPEERFASTKNRFYNEALNMEVFKTVNIFTEKNCFEYCSELSPHKQFMESTRAYGFWIWKSFLISELMKSVPENDIICYADLGCSFNPNGKERLSEYYQLAIENGSLCFDTFHLEKKYTKFDTYARIFPSDDCHLDTGHRCATVYFLKNNKANKKIIEEFKSISIENNYHYIDDSKSLSLGEYNFLIEHRYDQSIFSLLSKKYNFYCIPDETWWPDPIQNWHETAKKYPIWATRIK